MHVENMKLIERVFTAYNTAVTLKTMQVATQ